MGHWRNDRKEGFGELVSFNNTVFKGTFVNDHKHGNGVIEYPDGTVKDEVWEHNRLIK